MADPQVIFGLGVSIVSLFVAWRFPVVPRAVAASGMAAGTALIGWSFLPKVGLITGALAVAVVALLVLSVSQHVALRARQPKPLRPTDFIWLHDAAFHIVTKTKVLNPELDQDAQCGAAALLVREALREGKIPSQGRLNGEVAFNDLLPEFWGLAALVHDKSAGPMFRVRPYDGVSPEVIALVGRYNGFRVSRRAVMKLWKPKHP